MRVIKYLILILLLFSSSCNTIDWAKVNKSATMSEEHYSKIDTIMKMRFHSIVFSPDNRYLACTGETKIFIYKTEDWSLYKELKHHTEPVEDVAFSPQGNLLISSGMDSKLVFWDTKTWKALLVYKGAIKGNISLSPDGNYFALNKHRPALAVGADFSSRIFSLYPFIKEKKIHSSVHYQQIMFPSGGKYFITLENVGILKIISLPDFRLVKRYDIGCSIWNSIKLINNEELIIHSVNQSEFKLEHTFLIFNFKEGRYKGRIRVEDFDLSSYSWIYSLHVFNKNLILFPVDKFLIVYSLIERRIIRKRKIDAFVGEGTANDKYFVFSTGRKVLVYRLDNLEFVKELHI